MQLYFTVTDVFLLVLVESIIALVMIVSIGMFRFSRTARYKLWSLGWVIFTASAATMLISYGQGLLWSDGLGLSGMMVGSLLFLDGIHGRIRRGKELLLYPLVVLLGFIILAVGLVFQSSYPIVFSIPGFFNTYACWITAIQLRKTETSRSIEFVVLTIGFALLGFSTFLYSFAIFWEIEAFLILAVSSGLILTGSGMLPFFIRKTSEALTQQNQISQLVNSILNHDIRNYVSSLSTSIELARTSEDEREPMLDLASEIIASIEEFVAEMRRFMATTTRFKAASESIDLLNMLKGVATRIQREYGISEENISIEAPIEPSVLTCIIAKELLWNISDNAFKHGSKKLEFNIQCDSSKSVCLVISDYAGGMPSETLDFLNDPNPFSSSIAPGLGLGLILIRGLSLLCGVKLRADNNVHENDVVGTVHSLIFDRAFH